MTILNRREVIMKQTIDFVSSKFFRSKKYRITPDTFKEMDLGITNSSSWIGSQLQMVTSFRVDTLPGMIEWKSAESIDPLLFKNSLFWYARIEGEPIKFAMVWDNKTFVPILYGILGGKLSNTKQRLKKETDILTDIEISLLYDPIVQCFLNPIRIVFQAQNPEIRISLDEIQDRSNGFSDILVQQEQYLLVPLRILWEDHSKHQVESLCRWIFPLSFLRKIYER